MSSPSPPPLPVSRSSRKPRSSSPHPSTGTTPSSKSRSHSRPPPHPSVPSNVLRQPSNASSNASSITYVEPQPLPSVSWRQRARDARHAEPSPPVSSEPTFPQDQGAYTFISSPPTELSVLLPAPSRTRQSTADERSHRAYIQPREPPRFIVQSPSSSSMDRESQATSWSQPSAREPRTNKARPSDTRHADDQAHIRTSSASGGLRSPADLARPSQRSSSRGSSRRREPSVSPQGTPTLPPPSPTFDYGSRSTSPQLSPNMQALSPGTVYSPQSAGSVSPEISGYDEYSRYPPAGEVDGDGRRSRTRSGRSKIVNEDIPTADMGSRRSRTRSGGPAVVEDTDARKEGISNKHSRQRSMTPSSRTTDEASSVQAVLVDDSRRLDRTTRSSRVAAATSTLPPAAPIPPRHPSLVSPIIEQGVMPPPLPPRRPSPAPPTPTILKTPILPPPTPKRERTKSSTLDEHTIVQYRTDTRERTSSSKPPKPHKAVTTDELSSALAYTVDNANREVGVAQSSADAFAYYAPIEVAADVQEVKRERTTTWTAGQAIESAFGSLTRPSGKDDGPAFDTRKRERTRSAGAEKENIRPPRERTKSAVAVTPRTRGDTFNYESGVGKRSRSKSGGTTLQESTHRDTVSDDMHAILMGQMPESPNQAPRSSRQTPKRRSSKGSTRADNDHFDEHEVARNRAEALAVLSAPNTPKNKGTPGKKSRPTTATPGETLRSSESAKLKGLGMNISFPLGDERLGHQTPVQGVKSAQGTTWQAPAPSPDYSQLFAALADPYTPPVPEELPHKNGDLEQDDFTHSEYDTDASRGDEGFEDNVEEVIWDGREQELSGSQQQTYEPSPHVPDLERKSSTLRPPTSKQVLTSSTSVSSLAWSGDEEVEKGMSFAASRLLAGLHDVPEKLSMDINTPDFQHGVEDTRVRTPTIMAPPAYDPQTSCKEGRQASQQKTWRSTLSSTATYQSLYERYGSLEMHRQELIFELTTTESAFVHDMRLVIRLFIQPLRDRSQPPTWIPGVPAEVGRLFDWLDDIVQLHAEFARVLHSARQSQYPVVLSCASLLMPLAARLEVHQPYLVRLDEVSRTIDAMMKQPESDFGEFLRMQSVSDEWDGLSLSNWLLKPVQRLTKYALFFKQILQSTPRNHPDHLPSLSLYHTTETVLRVMQEVKAREEEYDMVKMLASRMAGLPAQFNLAQRGRRLLAQGPLLRLEGSERASGEFEERNGRGSKQPRSRTGTYNPRVSMQSINHSDGSSYEWPSTPSLALPSSPYSSADGVSTLRTPSSNQADYFSKQPRSRPGSIRSVSNEGRVNETPIYAFIFSDAVVLATPLSERNPLLQNTKRSKRAPQWRLLSDVGLVRVLGFSQLSEKFGFEFVLELDLLPMSFDATRLSETSCSTTAYLTLPDSPLAEVESLLAMKQTWTNAFEASMFHTIRSISFPSVPPFQIPLEFGASISPPTSPTARGSALPRSPSAFVQDNANPVDTERGERAWWSHRFKQVAAEFMHDRNFQPSIVAVQTGPEGTPAQVRDKSDRRKRMSTVHHGGPAPLALVTSTAANTKVVGKDGGIGRSDSQGGIMKLLSRSGRR